MSPSCGPLVPPEGSGFVGWCRHTSQGFFLMLLCLFVLNIRLGDLLTLSEVKDSDGMLPATPCWQVEQFVVASECKKCTLFEVKTRAACVKTGFAMKINCPESQREEYKSCRSASMEETLFWRFEGTVISLAVVFAAAVVLRQRALDRLASEKVRKQIESI
ncbi:protein JTB [Pristis pectinata]|uniref:protein JTB n=1 Tax=Pristis pectinata TaxID=685728 RepID=UPI00223CB35B|nr:protein JTB [Pristis pectinata]